MKASVIIPVWNGEAVLGQCPEALFAHSDATTLEVICVNNASQDGSAGVIARFPQVRLLEQPVNLGFAGGVNAGLNAAQGDLLVLLNQDCLVHQGWLATISAAFSQDAATGIVGGTLFTADGAVDHAGGRIDKPEGYGLHQKTLPSGDGPRAVEYVTGALFAIRRRAWEAVGPLDDGFYPGYFEESDYCYRARHKGFETVYVPDLQATHLRSSREWQVDPLKHGANQHRSRYRFISKHFSAADLTAFFAAETQTVTRETTHVVQNIGRWLALRDTLRDLPEIASRRHEDLEQSPLPEHERLLRVGFSQLLRRTWSHLQHTGAGFTRLQPALGAGRARLQELQAQEHDLLEKIYVKHPHQDQPESAARRLWRLLILRPLSIITLREFLLLSKLSTLHVARIDQLEEHVRLLEILTDYEYR